MNNYYYAIYPAPKGLEVSNLGKHDDFDLATVADAFDERAKQRDPSIWIANQQDLLNLQLTIAESLIR